MFGSVPGALKAATPIHVQGDVEVRYPWCRGDGC